ncbi:MAG: hypothetical protein LBO66_15285 [Deltaproteobacteria bacterium]|jgi:hypothetical protein|nr:hypothetical protein [Deltaproteobacteria bacterium]
MKKSPLALLALLCALALFLAQAPAWAQAPAAPALPPEVLSDKTPLAEKDIDFYIEVLTLTASPDFTETQFRDLIAQRGYTETHALAVSTKIGVGLTLLQYPETRSVFVEQFGTDEIIPSDADLALVKAHLPRLNQALENVASSVGALTR